MDDTGPYHAVGDDEPRVLELFGEPRSGAPHLERERARRRHRRLQRRRSADGARALQERHPDLVLRVRPGIIHVI